jgi:hypothetical protein
LFNSSEHVFVKNSVNDWVNLGTLIKRHFGQPGHSGYVEMSENFMSIVEGQKDDVMSILSSAFQDKITRNRSILHSILKTIYLCGKQNIPLRGHTEEKSNFIALINITTGLKLIKFWLLICKTVPQMQGIHHPPYKMN